MPSWIDILKSGICEDKVVDRALQSRIMANGEYLTGEERITFIFGMLSARQGVNIALQTPFIDVKNAAYIVSGMLIYDFSTKALGKSPLIRGDVVLITRQIGLGVQALLGINFEKVNIGEIWDIQTSNLIQTVQGHGRPRLIVSPPRTENLTPHGIKVDTVVIDATHPLTLERLPEIIQNKTISAARQILIVVPLGYSSEQLETESMKWLKWFWDYNAINEARKYLGSLSKSPEQNLMVSKWTREFLVCDDTKTDDALFQVRKRLAQLSKIIGINPPFFLLQAWGIYHRLSSLCVPLGQYEEMAFQHHYARTLKQQIDQLTQNSENPIGLKGISTSAWASEWRPLLEALLNAYNYLRGDEPPKFWPVAFRVEEKISSKFVTPLVIVCPTQMEGQLLLRRLTYLNPDLYDYLHPGGLNIFTPRSFASYGIYDGKDVLLTGPFASRWRYLSPTVRVITTIVYPHEVEPEQYIFDSQIRYLTLGASFSNRIKYFSRLGLCSEDEIQALSSQHLTTSVGTDSSYSNVEYIFEQIEGQALHKPYTERSQSVSDLITPSWAWDSEDLSYVPPISRSANLPKLNTVTAQDIQGPRVRFTLENNIELWAPYGQVFDVYRSVTDELEEQIAEQIERGDILVIIDDSGYSSLYDRIIEALETHPNYALLRVWLNLWISVKMKVLNDCDNSYTLLHQKLQSKGIFLTEQAVRSWYSGIMAPRDDNTVGFLIDSSMNKSAIANKIKIRDSLGHIRGMRRATGRRIKDLIKRTAVSKAPERTFSSEIDLAVEDVLAASITVRVSSVERFE